MTIDQYMAYNVTITNGNNKPVLGKGFHSYPLSVVFGLPRIPATIDDFSIPMKFFKVGLKKCIDIQLRLIKML